MLLPIAAAAISYGITMSLPNVYPEGWTESYWPAFLIVMPAIYAVFMVVAWFVPQIRKRLVNWSYLFAAVFFL